MATANLYTDNVSILLNDGDGTFPVVTNYLAGESMCSPIFVFSTDLDGNGSKDLAIANYVSDNVSILLGNGEGTFQSAVNYRVGDHPYSIFSIDFDGDGDNDLATANQRADNAGGRCRKQRTGGDQPTP